MGQVLGKRSTRTDEDEGDEPEVVPPNAAAAELPQEEVEDDLPLRRPHKRQKRDRDESTASTSPTTMLAVTTDLSVSLQLKFFKLFSEIGTLIRETAEPTSASSNEDPQERDEARLRRFHQRLSLELQHHPELARAAHQQYYTLLVAILVKHRPNHEPSPALDEMKKCMIDANPSALLTELVFSEGQTDTDDSSTFTPRKPTLHLLYLKSNWNLLPHVARYHSWILDTPSVRQLGVPSRLCWEYAKGDCDASLLQAFFRYYPRGLQQQQAPNNHNPDQQEQDQTTRGDLPLHICFNRCLIYGWDDSDEALYKYLAELYPPAVTTPSSRGEYALHEALLRLLPEPPRERERFVRVSQFLIANFPQLVHKTDSDGDSPLSYIRGRLHLPYIQELAIQMIRRVVVHQQAQHYLNSNLRFLLANHPFYRQVVNEVLVPEYWLRWRMLVLQRASGIADMAQYRVVSTTAETTSETTTETEASETTTTTRTTLVGTVYQNWAKEQYDQLQDQVHHLLQHTLTSIQQQNYIRS